MKMTYSNTLFCKIIIEDSDCIGKFSWNVIHKKSKLNLGKIRYSNYLKQYILVPSVESVIITFTQLREIYLFISNL
jgi:hypothetical protein